MRQVIQSSLQQNVVAQLMLLRQLLLLSKYGNSDSPHHSHRYPLNFVSHVAVSAAAAHVAAAAVDADAGRYRYH